MTDKQKYLYACKFAVLKLMEKGSSSLAVRGIEDKPIIIRWEDVLDWIEKEEVDEK